MEIKMLRSMTFDDSLDNAFRRTEPESITGKNIQKALEKEGSDGKPLVLIVVGLREGRQPGDYTLREVRRVMAYRSKTFLGAEQKRHAEEEEKRKQVTRTFRLNQIKAEIRTKLKAESVEREKDGEDFDVKYAEQEERAIEKEAAMILEAEELDNQINNAFIQ